MISYEPLSEHHGKKLACVYEQYDHNQQLLYGNMDFVDLQLSHLGAPSLDAEIPSIQVFFWEYALHNS